MCEFPSWIETDAGEIVFLKDKDIDAYLETHPNEGWNDPIGHDAIRKITGARGRECELHYIPYEIQVAILKGEMTKMYKAAGYDNVFLRGKHVVNEGRVLAFGWSIIEAKDNSQVEARDNSKVEARDNSKVTALDNSQIKDLRVKEREDK